MTEIFCEIDCKILKLHGGNGNFKCTNSVCISVQNLDSSEIQKLKTYMKGVIQYDCKEGDKKNKGDLLFTISKCQHRTIINDSLCGLCGETLNKGSLFGFQPQNNDRRYAVCPGKSNIKVDEKTAMELSMTETLSLIRKRKLVLLVDLDMTILHTTNYPFATNLKDVFEYELNVESNKQSNFVSRHYTKLRPGCLEFLEEMYQLFEMQIFTFGNRSYAHKIREKIDPTKKYFVDRITSRDDSFDTRKKTANLKSLFPRGDNMVCIIDDRTEVWNDAPNLVHVKPYFYFPDVGDINNPFAALKSEQQKANISKDAKSNSNHQLQTTNNMPHKLDMVGFNSTESKSELKTDVQKEKSSVKVSNSKKSLTESPDEIMTDKSNSIENSNSGKHASKNDSNELTSEKVEETSPDLEVVNKKREVISAVKPDEDVEMDDNKDVTQEKRNIESSETQQGDINVQNGSEVKDTPEKVIRNNGIVTKQAVKETKEPEMEPPRLVQSETSNQRELPDNDDYLVHLARILKDIHRNYYDELDRMVTENKSVPELVDSGQLPDVKHIMSNMRAKVMTGAQIAMSGIVRQDKNPDDNDCVKVIRNLGGAYVDKVTLPHLTDKTIEHDIHKAYTTHLICISEGTEKLKRVCGYVKRVNHFISEAGLANSSSPLIKLPTAIHRIHLVSPEWLWKSYFLWQRAEESDCLFHPRIVQTPPPAGHKDFKLEPLPPTAHKKRNFHIHRTSGEPSNKKPRVSSVAEINTVEAIVAEFSEDRDDSMLLLSSSSSSSSSENSFGDVPPDDSVMLHFSLDMQQDMMQEVEDAMNEERECQQRNSSASPDHNTSSDESSSSDNSIDSGGFQKKSKYCVEKESEDENEQGFYDYNTSESDESRD